MSWLLSLDESGHDHKTVPYEIHGGIAIHAEKLWPFISAVRTLEQSCFGACLHEYGSELKGSKLLDRKRFLWAGQSPRMDEGEMRKHALNFLNSCKEGRSPRRDEFTACGQASLAVVERIIQLLQGHAVKLFASAIPSVPKVPGTPDTLLRKDIVFLLERFFYFLEEQNEIGLLVMDRTEKSADQKLVRQMEGYFTKTMRGQQRAMRIVPSPLFVESDMAYGVQVADLCIYCLNWGWRAVGMDSPVRPEVRDFVWMLENLFWHGQRCNEGREFDTHSVFYVRDPYTSRMQ
jgi:hypothetical protein